MTFMISFRKNLKTENTCFECRFGYLIQKALVTESQSESYVCVFSENLIAKTSETAKKFQSTSSLNDLVKPKFLFLTFSVFSRWISNSFLNPFTVWTFLEDTRKIKK